MMFIMLQLQLKAFWVTVTSTLIKWINILWLHPLLHLALKITNLKAKVNDSAEQSKGFQLIPMEVEIQ